MTSKKSNATTLNIFIDTNIVNYGSVLYKNTQFNYLVKLSKKGYVKLHVSKVVLEELKKHYLIHCEKTIQNIEKLRKNLDEHVIDIYEIVNTSNEMDIEIIDLLERNYSNNMSKYLELSKIVIVNNHEPDLDTMIKSAVNRKGAFTEIKSDKGICDYIIVGSYKEFIRSNELENVYFVSNDEKLRKYADEWFTTSNSLSALFKTDEFEKAKGYFEKESHISNNSKYQSEESKTHIYEYVKNFKYVDLDNEFKKFVELNDKFTPDTVSISNLSLNKLDIYPSEDNTTLIEASFFVIMQGFRMTSVNDAFMSTTKYPISCVFLFVIKENKYPNSQFNNRIDSVELIHLNEMNIYSTNNHKYYEYLLSHTV